MMGYDLARRDGRCFTWSVFSWGPVLALAQSYDWRPAGTESGPLWNRGVNGEWDGSYDTNDGQWVTDADARELAAALTRSLDDIPDHEARKPGLAPLSANNPRLAPVIRALAHAHGGALMSENMASLTQPLEWFSGGRKVELMEFIQFCEGGGFNIN